MIERKTIVDRIEITREGAMQVRIGLLLVDGDKELGCKWHRAMIQDPSAPNAVTLAMYEVNTHLVKMGEEPVGQEDIDKLVAHAALTTK